MAVSLIKSTDVVKAPAKKRSSAKAIVITRIITLRTLHDDIMRDNKNAIITTKKMRVYLRANHNDIHARNDAWTFSQAEYDTIRSHFDPAYRAKLEKAKKPVTKRVRKIDQVTDVADANVPAVIAADA